VYSFLSSEWLIWSSS